MEETKMKKFMYNVIAGLLALAIVLTVVYGLTNNTTENKTTISVTNEEVENEIKRIYGEVAEESVKFFNAYGSESFDW